MIATFIGDIFNERDDTFYIYEPLTALKLEDGYPGFGCDNNNNWGKVGFKKFDQRCRNTADHYLISKDATQDCDAGSLKNVGNYKNGKHRIT